MADAVVTERVSNAPSAPRSSMLSGDKMAEFAGALGNQTPESAPEPAAPPSEQTRTETVEAPPTPEPAPPQQPPAQRESTPPPPAAPPQPQRQPLGPVPYERFQEENRLKNEALAAKAEFERRLSQDVKKLSDEATAKKLIEIAEAYPELAPAIFGTPTPPKMPEAQPAPGAPPAAPKPPQDPLVMRNLEMEKRIKTLEGIHQRQQQAEVIRQIEARADAQIDKHAVFKDPVIREAAEEVIVNYILTRPHIPPEKIVDDVAAKYKAIEASIRQTYEARKKEVVKSVAPGVGPGAPPAPPGFDTNKKPSFKDGSTVKLLAAALNAVNKQG